MKAPFIKIQWKHTLIFLFFNLFACDPGEMNNSISTQAFSRIDAVRDFQANLSNNIDPSLQKFLPYSLADLVNQSEEYRRFEIPPASDLGKATVTKMKGLFLIQNPAELGRLTKVKITDAEGNEKSSR